MPHPSNTIHFAIHRFPPTRVYLFMSMVFDEANPTRDPSLLLPIPYVDKDDHRSHKSKKQRLAFDAWVYEQHMAGIDNVQIGRRAGRHRRTIENCIRRHEQRLAGIVKPYSTTLREFRRYDRMIETIWQRALTNDIDPETGFPTMTQKEAIDLVLKLSKAQRELVGADAAQKLDIKATAKVEERVEDVDAAQLARFMELGEKMARAGLVSHGAVDERREEVIAEARRVGIRLVPDDD